MEVYGFFGTLMVLIWLGAIMFIASRYKRCPSDKVIVVYGRTENLGVCKCVHGGGVFVWPLIQDYGILSLAPMNTNVEICNALAQDNNKVALNASVVFAISTNARNMMSAAERLLSFTTKEIENIVKEIAFGQIKLVIAKNDTDRLIKDEFRVVAEIQEMLNEEINKLGLQVMHINLENVTIIE